MAEQPIIHTQREAAWIVSKAVYGQCIVGRDIRVTPREPISLDAACGEWWMSFGIARVTVTGDDQPLHPDHVRSLRDQCAAAGVEFVFLSWGDWLPHSESRWFDEERVLSKTTRRHLAWGRVYKVGAANSGNLLDGVRHEVIRDQLENETELDHD